MKKLGLCILAGVLVAPAASAEHHEKAGDNKTETPALTGVFADEDGYVATFMPQGYLVGVDAATGAAGLIVKYGARDGVIWLLDLAPPAGAGEAGAKCAMENRGEYNYAEEDGVLTFSVIEDPCAPRVESVEAVRLMRVTAPAPASAE